jgi:hypothetical protein
MSIVKFPLRSIMMLLSTWLMGMGCYSLDAQQLLNKQGYWVSYMGDNKLNSKIGIHSEAQLRNYGVRNTAETGLFRVGINYYAAPSTMLTAGYGFFYSSPDDETTKTSTLIENRAWQQMMFRKKTPGIFMEHRYRLEQRFIENTTLDTSLVSHRIRYRFQVIFPFYTISPHLRHFFFASYNELMLNFKKNSADVFDRNRLYFALGIQVSPKLNFQLGYLNQQANQSYFPNSEINHLAQFAISYNMDDLMRSFFRD